MSYTPHSFVDGNVLHAAELNDMDEQIQDNADALETIPTTYRTAADQDLIDAGKMDEPQTEGTAGQVLTTDGLGGRSWTTVSGGGGGEELELIEEITIEAGTSEISRTTDTQGNPYSFKRFFVLYQIVDPSGTNAGANLQFDFNNDRRIFASNGGNSNGFMLSAFAENIAGNIYYVGGSMLKDSWVPGNNVSLKPILFDSGVTKLRLWISNAGFSLPTGTLTIYGVKL